MKKLFSILILTFLPSWAMHAQISPKEGNVEKVLDIIKHKNKYPNYILVSAHRGYWADFPENTIDAFNMAIDAGADIVEMDVRITKDSVMVVFHDACLDRMTNGYGRLNQFPYSDIHLLYLKDHEGNLTKYSILTVDEALDAMKGRAVVALDIKEGGDVFDKVFVWLVKKAREKGMLGQCIIKGKMPLNKLLALLEKAGVLLTDFLYTPIAFANTKNLAKYINDYVNTGKIFLFELVYKQSKDPTLAYVKLLKDHGIWLGQYSFWPEDPDGVVAEQTPLTDSDSIVRNYDFKDKDPDNFLDDGRGNWPWLFSMGANYVITDRSELMITYLTLEGKRVK